MSDHHLIGRLSVNLLAIVGGFCQLIVFTPMANLLARPLDRIKSSPMNANVIVVLSGGRYTDRSLNEAALERTITGVRLYRQGLAPLLLFTGGPCCGTSASSLMANLAAELGVPKSSIIIEEQSLRTAESATKTAAIFRSQGMRSAILVTSPLHMLRAQLAFESAGILVHAVCASEKDLRLVSSAEERVSLLKSTIHEYLGLGYYRIRRWISK
jgi:uncharacterized SAM-binding protein YcdF (DUF218 family)